MIQPQQAIAKQELQRRRRNQIFLIGIVIAVAVIVGIAGIIQHYQEVKAPQATTISADPGSVTKLENTAPIRIGLATAPHIVTLWEDAHCVHCEKLERIIGTTLLEEVQRGQVRLELYPLQIIDQGSARAAAAQGCAASYGRALNYHLGIWENPHSRWTLEQLQELSHLTGGEYGNDIAACIASGQYEEWAKSLDTAANTAGIQGTPVLIVDGNTIDLTAFDVALFKEKLR
ncbi:MAG: DsbA family protein [Propionibacteriaceae bacterium]